MKDVHNAIMFDRRLPSISVGIYRFKGQIVQHAEIVIGPPIV